MVAVASARVPQMGKFGVPYFGVLRKRILYTGVPYSRKLPNASASGLHGSRGFKLESLNTFFGGLLGLRHKDDGSGVRVVGSLQSRSAPRRTSGLDEETMVASVVRSEQKPEQ